MSADEYTADPEGRAVVPRQVVVLIVIVLLGVLVLDVGAQFIPGSTHEASPVLDGLLLSILGGTVAASRGPKPATDPDPPPPPEATPRHRRAPEEGP